MKHRVAEVNKGLALGFFCTNWHGTQRNVPPGPMLSLQYSKRSLASSLPDSPSLPHAQHSGLHRCQPRHFPKLDTLSFTSLSLRPPWVTPSLLGYSSTPSRSGSGATFSRKSFTSCPGRSSSSGHHFLCLFTSKHLWPSRSPAPRKSRLH